MQMWSKKHNVIAKPVSKHVRYNAVEGAIVEKARKAVEKSSSS